MSATLTRDQLLYLAKNAEAAAAMLTALAYQSDPPGPERDSRAKMLRDGAIEACRMVLAGLGASDAAQ